MWEKVVDEVPDLEPTDVPNVDASDLPEDGVVIRGPVAEITMHLYGRVQHEELEYSGEPAARSSKVSSITR